MNGAISRIATLAVAAVTGFAVHQYAVSNRSSLPLFAQTLAATSEIQIRDFFARPQPQSTQKAAVLDQVETARNIAPRTPPQPHVNDLKFASAAQAITSMARTFVAKTHVSGNSPSTPTSNAEAVGQIASTVGEPDINNHDVWVTEPYASTGGYAGWENTRVIVTPRCTPALVSHQTYWCD